jgi:Zn-dependent M28 family amino/carboxypeptidase
MLMFRCRPAATIFGEIMHIAQSPVGKVLSSEDIVPPIVFLASDDARHITGSGIASQQRIQQAGFSDVGFAANHHACAFANEAAAPGVMDVKISLRLPPPIEKPVSLRNVAGLLPGSDPALAGTYILLSAHYDHIGRKPDGEGDLIYNGANDNASGVASVIEIAAALSGARPGPGRSILFVAYFGEEKGLLGSRYYGRHPLVPLKQTVADLNLEHLGRTDGDNGKHAGTATMTGYGYSDITAAFELAGGATGVKIYTPEKNGDDYFARSDNQSLADQGVPAHTILTSFEFPDYHKVGDEWNKIDYTNLAKVDRAIALTVMMI